ncbi:MAG TPA: SDR family oxidoreductase [Candidatus Salinicoccus stercoripullorum]|uniref:SDR family oxidoreductase n=1 Tax=Candidatus Salinicoccus stercoripullorum TaxID=2838756 RepID=A0A9D1QJ13_9STAP|nr:SDR family oxidoreductase [Candidatus Salinicoccus stercoripullorum]
MSEMNNPLYKHYDGKFEKQEQPYPGVQNKMHPVPDCGEESYSGNNQLADRKALVTGGDSGIGRAAAIAYAKEGADVAISYLPDEESDAQEVKAVIEKAGRKAVLLPGDLRDEEFARNLVHEAAEKLDGLDILVLNAAIQQFEKDIKNLSTQQLTDTFTVNIFSNVWMLQEAMDHLPEGGSVIVTTSVQAFNPSGHLSDYAMTKSAQVAFVIAMTGQLAEKGIRINAVSPGPVWTVLQVAGGQPQEKIPEFGQKVPLKRAGQPVELAPTYVLLASDSASFTTGQVYGITGGTAINQ